MMGGGSKLNKVTSLTVKQQCANNLKLIFVTNNKYLHNYLSGITRYNKELQ